MEELAQDEKQERNNHLFSLKLWQRVLLYSALGFLAVEALFLAWIWPNWQMIHQGQVPISALIKDYQSQQLKNPGLPPLKWKPLQKPLPNRLKKVFIYSEDSRFYTHGGVDFQAIQDAIEYNWQHGRIVLGASTISQQTAKNMFLSLSRNPLRKFNELLLTYLLESKLSKAEIIHIYLNIAEFGTGIYGIEAAARYYYQTSAYQLSQSQAAELAASLPSPKKNNPRTRTRFFQKHVARLIRTLQLLEQYSTPRTQAHDKSPDIAAATADLEKKLQVIRELNASDADSQIEMPAPEQTIHPEPALEESKAKDPPEETQQEPAVEADLKILE